MIIQAPSQGSPQCPQVVVELQTTPPVQKIPTAILHQVPHHLIQMEVEVTTETIEGQEEIRIWQYYLQETKNIKAVVQT